MCKRIGNVMVYIYKLLLINAIIQLPGENTSNFFALWVYKRKN